jgi:dTDP-4-dehydrorhamnose reductase
VTDNTTGGISWKKFAEEIVKQSSFNVKVIPIKTEDYPRPAPRPKNSVLDLTMVRLVLDEDLVSWDKSLKKFLSELEYNNSLLKDDV